MVLALTKVVIRFSHVRGWVSLCCLGALLGCATAEQSSVPDNSAPDLGGAGSDAGRGGSGTSNGGGGTSAGGALGSSGAVGTSGSTSVAGSAGSGASQAGSSGSAAGSGGTAASSSGAGGASGGATGTAGKSGTAGSSSGGTTGTAGANGTAGATGTAGTTGTAGATGSAGATSGSGTVLFSDDFEDGNANGWITSGGTWAVATDGSKVYAQTASGTGSTVILSSNGSNAWTDQIIQARVKVTAFGGSSTSYFAALYARYNGTDYYALLLRSDGNLVIRKDKSSIGNAVNAGIVAGTWYTVRLELVGPTLKAYLNGTLQSTVTDSSLTAGGIAVSTVNSAAEFDDIKVTKP